MFKILKNAVLLAICCFCVTENTRADDWPMWRHDAGRTAVTTENLPDTLSLSWTLKRPQLEPAWPNQPQLQFDVGYEPIVAGGTMFVGSSMNDSLTAYDVKTGQELWQFFAEGPIRFAPAAVEDKVFFSSDDGHLYCLHASDGKLLWKFRGAPSNRKVLGNKQLISAWPARGAPVVAEGKVYFAASIWPFMGTFVYAIDIETGSVVWENDGTGSLFLIQPHDSPAFGGVTPQGYLAISDGNLLVPNGRSIPACFDLATGELKYFHLGANKRTGNFAVAAGQGLFINAGRVYDTATGHASFKMPSKDLPVFAEGILYSGGSKLRAYDAKSSVFKTALDRKGRKITEMDLTRLWSVNGKYDLWLKAGNRLYCSQSGKKIAAFHLDSKTGQPAIVWEQSLKGKVCSMIAANKRLIVSTVKGEIHCFAQQSTAESSTKKKVTQKKMVADSSSDKRIHKKSVEHKKSIEQLIKNINVTNGYCLAFGLKDGRWLTELAHQTQLKIIGVEPDASTVSAIRNRLDDLSLYGRRISVHETNALEFDVSPYLADMIVSENIPSSGIEQGVPFIRKVFHCLRPYGGVAVFELSEEQHAKFQSDVKKANLKNAQVTRIENSTLLKRVGALKGSGDWTHQYADASNTSVSKDRLVKAPLGILWFGGSTNKNILPRHGHGPTEQVIGGRLFIEGTDSMRAMDVYTGRVLWETELPGVGTYYNNTSHQPGANSVGSNYVSVEDGVYIAYGKKGLWLDPKTGKILAEFKLPADGKTKAPEWGYIGLWKNLLIVGSSPIKEEGKKPGTFTQDGTTSKSLVVLDRHSGKVLWQKKAEFGFRHNAIAIGDDKIFCIDRLPDSVVEKMKRRGLKMNGVDRLLAFDAASGEKIWSSDKNIFGTWLGYSEEFGILLQSGRAANDMLKTEPANRMITYRGNNGDIVWDRFFNYGGPCLLHHQTIITQNHRTVISEKPRKVVTQNRAVDLLTGKVQSRTNPITGAKSPWNCSRNYGCNSAVGSEHLLTFRSAAAGFFDLLNDSGTGNMGGFKSGCTSNLIVANGVLNAPDYTRTCSCAYQNQTSLALIHMPEMEMWTFNSLKLEKKRIRRLGINFGAPGDRKADDGTLWLEYPYVGGLSPKVPVEVLPKSVKWFRHHAFSVEQGKKKWITSSGVVDVESLRMTLNPRGKETRKYTVRLHFTEPENLSTGERVFSILIQNELKISKFDPVSLAGAPHRAIVKQFSGVEVKKDLVIQFKQNSGNKSAGAVLCGIEVFEESVAISSKSSTKK